LQCNDHHHKASHGSRLETTTTKGMVQSLQEENNIKYQIKGQYDIIWKHNYFFFLTFLNTSLSFSLRGCKKLRASLLLHSFHAKKFHTLVMEDFSWQMYQRCTMTTQCHSQLFFGHVWESTSNVAWRWSNPIWYSFMFMG